MKAGEFPDGARTLRAKIDVNAANVLAARSGAVTAFGTHRIIVLATNGAFTQCTTGAHTLSDYIEGITHSICTLEFEVHRRALPTGFLDALELPEPRPHQYEFARLI